MVQTGFINRPMSIALDAVRGLAALIVLLGHAAQHDIYTGPIPFPDSIQHQAVVVFFVLSGLVIANVSFQRPGSLADYAVARLARVMPVALFAVLFSALAWLVGNNAPHGIIDVASRFNQPDVASLVLPLVFLSETDWGSGPLWNAPYWSLVYEVWFYALFGAALYLRGWQRVLVLALLVPLAGLRVLLLLPLWLLGVALARWASARPLSEARAAITILTGFVLALAASKLAFVLSPVLDHWALPLTDNLYMSRYAMSDTLLGLGVALAFLGLRTLADQCAATLEKYQRPIGWLAGCSFTIYLIHWPILNLLHGYGITAGSSLIGLFAILALIVAFCGQVAKVTEHRRGDVRRWLQRRLPTRWTEGGPAPKSPAVG
jgi:peptidoglycan/LPS O-acetylase OafA/YrhL